MKRFVFTIGDGTNRSMEFSGVFDREVMPSAETFRMMIISWLRPVPAIERLIEDAEVDRDETSATMVINEGPNGECAPNSGPWLVAKVEEVQP